MCSNARKIVVVAHVDKFGRQAAHRICRLDEIDILVCDGTPETQTRLALQSAAVTVQ
jgi:DeoR family glycerol-3-phosphate regulon repressor